MWERTPDATYVLPPSPMSSSNASGIAMNKHFSEEKWDTNNVRVRSAATVARPRGVASQPSGNSDYFRANCSSRVLFPQAKGPHQREPPPMSQLFRASSIRPFMLEPAHSRAGVSRWRDTVSTAPQSRTRLGDWGSASTRVEMGRLGIESGRSREQNSKAQSELRGVFSASSSQKRRRVRAGAPRAAAQRLDWKRFPYPLTCLP